MIASRSHAEGAIFDRSARALPCRGRSRAFSAATSALIEGARNVPLCMPISRHGQSWRAWRSRRYRPYDYEKVPVGTP